MRPLMIFSCAFVCVRERDRDIERQIESGTRAKNMFIVGHRDTKLKLKEQ